MNKTPMIILYVADQKKSTAFYSSVLGSEPVVDVPGMTEFMISAEFKLGLMPENGIAKLICPPTKHPSSGNGIPRCELYLIVENPQLSLIRAVSAGATEISKMEMRDWGDSVSYCQDPDGHIIAFAK